MGKAKLIKGFKIDGRAIDLSKEPCDMEVMKRSIKEPDAKRAALDELAEQADDNGRDHVLDIDVTARRLHSGIYEARATGIAVKTKPQR